MERILVMNLGSTSSKIAVYDDDKELFSQTLRHSKEEMSAFDDVLEQFDFRKEKIYEALAQNDISLESITCACSRGGNILACPHGAIGVDQAMIDYLTRPEDSARHASLLGSMVAFDLAKEFGIPALIYDAIGTDEKQPIARVSGVPELPHFTVGHTLNTRAMGIKCAEKLGKKFDECTFIVAHLGGGSSIRLYKNGVNIDSVNDDEGNFSPERGGGVSAKALIDMCFSGKYSYKEMARKIHGNGGFKAHLNTSDALEVENMALAGDEYAKMIYDAMSYNVAKDIGKLAVVVGGKVDRIIITGGIAYSEMVTDLITEMVGFIAPVEVMPGEYEMEALAAGALRVLKGEEEMQDFGKIAAESVERLRIIPGLEPGTVPKKYFE
ncbi:MAG: butyrate kinase [Clostridiales bacterium]|nr:butyrate kinase [Candidatus Crickella caballi]